MSTLSAAETQTSRKLTFGQAVREALAEEMRRGEARIIDDAPLVARAVDSMLATLRESQGVAG